MKERSFRVNETYHKRSLYRQEVGCVCCLGDDLLFCCGIYLVSRIRALSSTDHERGSSKEAVVNTLPSRFKFLTTKAPEGAARERTNAIVRTRSCTHSHLLTFLHNLAGYPKGLAGQRPQYTYFLKTKRRHLAGLRGCWSYYCSQLALLCSIEDRGLDQAFLDRSFEYRNLCPYG